MCVGLPFAFVFLSIKARANVTLNSYSESLIAFTNLVPFFSVESSFEAPPSPSATDLGSFVGFARSCREPLPSHARAHG